MYRIQGVEVLLRIHEGEGYFDNTGVWGYVKDAWGAMLRIQGVGVMLRIQGGLF